jgi:hypothetical protein
VLGTENRLAVGEHPLPELYRLPRAPRHPIGVRDDYADAQRVEVPWAENPLAVREHPLPDLDRLPRAPRHIVG